MYVFQNVIFSFLQDDMDYVIVPNATKKRQIHFASKKADLSLREFNAGA